MSKTGLESMVSGRDPLAGHYARCQEIKHQRLIDAARHYRVAAADTSVTGADEYRCACTTLICAALSFAEDKE